MHVNFGTIKSGSLFLYQSLRGFTSIGLLKVVEQEKHETEALKLFHDENK